jgi:hypothetical protein
VLKYWDCKKSIVILKKGEKPNNKLKNDFKEKGAFIRDFPINCHCNYWATSILAN